METFGKLLYDTYRNVYAADNIEIEETWESLSEDEKQRWHSIADRFIQDGGLNL